MMWIWSRIRCRWLPWTGSRAAWLALPAALAAGTACLPMPGPLPPAPHYVPPAVVQPAPIWQPAPYLPPPDIYAPTGWGVVPAGYVPVLPDEYGSVPFTSGAPQASGYGVGSPGAGVPPSGAVPVDVPEPNSLNLLVAGALMLAMARRLA